jgi:hypothetical protein
LPLWQKAPSQKVAAQSKRPTIQSEVNDSEAGMSNMASAPRDGRYVAVSMGGDALAFAYFENGSWIAPQMIGKPELGFSFISPISWVNIPAPRRH